MAVAADDATSLAPGGPSFWADDQGDVVDVLVWGASGFTGRLVTRYLYRRAQQAAAGDASSSSGGSSGADAAAASSATSATASAPGLKPFTWAVAGREQSRAALERAVAVAHVKGDFGKHRRTGRVPPPAAGAAAAAAASGGGGGGEKLAGPPWAPQVRTVANDAVSGNRQDLLGKLVRGARVVIACAGPFSKVGFPLAQACAAAGIDYVDITGETDYVAALVAAHDSTLRRDGVFFVPCCGYDSVPSDLGALFAVNALRERHGADTSVASVTSFAEGSMGVSGGTVATLMNSMSASAASARAAPGAGAAHAPDPQSAMRDPYLLVPPAYQPAKGSTARVSNDLLPLVTHDPDVCTYGAPFVMASSNCKIVRRSNAERSEVGRGYGKDKKDSANFVYAERMRATSRLAAAATSAVMFLFMILLAIPPTRKLLARYVLPAPGTGEGEVALEDGWMKFTAVARSTDKEQTPVVTTLKFDHGAYVATARTVGEAALLLAQNRDDVVRHAGGLSGGVLTPASCLGELLIDRLAHPDVGFKFEVADELR